MTPPNPSEAAREAARTIAMRIDNLLADCNCAGGLKRQFEEYALLEVQAAIDSALSASAARVKELEVLLQVCVDNLSEYVWRERDCEEWCEPQYLSEARAALSIKVGETK